MKKLKKAERILHLQFKEYGCNAREWMRKCVMILPEIDDAKIWEKKGFKSLSHYAAVLAGMGYKLVTDGLRILRRTANMPNIRKVIEERGINIIRPIETILTLENEEFWANKARQMSKSSLEVYVREFKKLHEKSSPRGNQNPEIPQQQAISKFEFEAQQIPLQTFESEPTIKKTIVMQLESEVLEQLEKLKGPGEWNDLMKQLLAMRTLELEEQKPAPVATDSRHIPNPIRRHVKARDNGHCAYPGCKKPISLDHHVDRFGLKKVHDPDRIYGLCTEHERLAHLGLIENELNEPKYWKIRTQPDKNLATFAIDLLVQKRRQPSGG